MLPTVPHLASKQVRSCHMLACYEDLSPGTGGIFCVVCQNKCGQALAADCSICMGQNIIVTIHQHAERYQASVLVRKRSAGRPKIGHLFSRRSDQSLTTVLNNRRLHLCMQPGKAVYRQCTSVHMGPHSVWHVQQTTFCLRISSQ